MAKEKYNHFELGYKGDRYGFRTFAGSLKEALKPVRMTTAEMSRPHSHDVLCFGDRFILPASHMKRLLNTCQSDTVLTFCFADDMKTVSISIEENNSRPTVITFKNQMIEQNAVYRNYFIWDLPFELYPAEIATETPETTPEPEILPAAVPPAVAPTKTTPKPRKRRQTAKKQPDPMPAWAKRLVAWLNRLADILDPQPVTN